MTDDCSFFNNGAAGAAPVFAQYLKDSKHPKYSIAQINDYPTTTYAVQTVTTLAYAWTSDSVLNGDRLAPIVFGGVCSPASSSSDIAAQGLILTFRSSILSATHRSRFGPFQRVGDGPVTSCQVQDMDCRVSAWRKCGRLMVIGRSILMQKTDLAGLMKFAPTTTKSEQLLWPA